MGVPKFFRYTSERYPCLNELVKQYQIPDFDNMYLDMNGIIHNCSHPDDSNPHFRITEEKIFQDIFHYISILFQIIKPKKLFFMAIDGVAPRAKMNQQRGRRFRSAREAEKLEEDAKAKGEILPTEKRFDSNCITPGTVFMAKLHEQLRYFVKEKMTTDSQWAKVKVILSGHETPGEGEHKIMDYIRWSRSQPDYDPNTRHCLYGLDADLIMLGMCTHEPHFALLREEVKFGKSTQRATSPEETNFYLLHLSLLREYLEQEFISIKDKLPFEYDLEKIVDDWVLMGFLVGNDFIPHLPHMHIGNDALPILYNTYMKVLPTLDGYINEAGDLNLARFETFMNELASLDKEKFQDVYADLKYFEGKTGRRPNAQERKEYKPNNDETFNVNVNDIKNNKPDDELQALINATENMFMEDGEEIDEDGEEYEETSDEEANMELEFKLHKKDYYMNKLDYSKVTDEVLADQAEGYVRAIQWNLYYYYKGCPSWCWYYPHHYAPYISDIKGFKNLKIEFEIGEPFKPFEQLLAVLPSASKHLLPTPFHSLMTDEDSPIVHYYPQNFETDLNGKRNDWEAVVLIPFIDETNLLSAMAPCYQRLTDEEIKRNTHGPMLVYNWSPASQGTVHAPEYFPSITDCKAIEKFVWRSELVVPKEELKRGMLPNAKRDMLFPGFPTMRHLKYKSSIKKCKVKVFDQPSRNESMIIEIIRDVPNENKLEDIAKEYLGKIIWVGWPHLTRAKVISVSNEKLRLHHVDQQNNNMNGVPTYTTETNAGNLHKQWLSERATVIEHNMNRLGIELADVKVIIHAVNLKGYKYTIQDNVKMVSEPEWCTIPCGYALQATVKDVSAHIIQEATKFSTPQEAYPPGDQVFLLTKGKYYGCLGTIVDSETIQTGRIKVQVIERPEPVVSSHAAASPYRITNQAAHMCGVSSQMLSRLTGSILVVSGERHDLPTEALSKVNIGLNLKFNKKNQEVSGYTRRCPANNMWLYSERCVELVRAYQRKFPELFERLNMNLYNDIFFESDLWPDEIGEKKPQEVASWLKSQPHATAARRECGSEALEPEEMLSLWKSIDAQLTEIKKTDKKVTLQVKWNLIYKPELHEGNIAPDSAADYKLYDRVVCVSGSITAPKGRVGTITAVYPPPNANTVRLSDRLNAQPTYQVMFDEPFPGASVEDLFTEPRFYRMLPTNMLNLSFGRDLRDTNRLLNVLETNTSYARENRDTNRSKVQETNTSYGRENRDTNRSKIQETNASYGRENRETNKTMKAQEPKVPTLLRRNDGHQSAFASYSPPSADKSPAAPPEPQKMTVQSVNNLPQPQDNATFLLRSLLKISEDNDAPKKNANDKNSPDTNWRKKSESTNAQIPPPPVSVPVPKQQPQQPQNWRKEMSNKPRPPPILPAEWTNSNFKSQPPVPPFPNFGQAPFPRPPEPPRPQPFPKHLPPVSGNVTLGPSWVHQQQPPKPVASSSKPNSNPVPSSAEKLSNPFVPLQVQTSQRRIQNSGNSSKKDDLPAPQPIHAQPQPSNPAVRQNKQDPSARPQRKKKPRIAANLPFQID